MKLDDEIKSIRRELKGVERNVAHLALRLDEVEARQRGSEADPSDLSGRPKTPEKAPAAAPPPLPQATKPVKAPESPQPVVPSFTATPKKAAAAPKAAPKPKRLAALARRQT